jgi:phosphonate transport system substrate-binding protein
VLEDPAGLPLCEKGKALQLLEFSKGLIEVFGVGLLRTVLAVYCLLLVLFCGAASGAAREEATYDSVAARQPPLQFGLLPYVSTRKLFHYYGPLKDYLERTLQRRIIMSTAPDFKTYLSRAQKGDYDIYHTAPHFAALAEREWGYRRLMCFSRELDGSVVVAKNGKVKSVEDLAGGVVRLPDELAIISFLGEEYLEAHGLESRVDVRYSPSHNNAILAVTRGEAVAAVSSSAVFEKMPADLRASLRVLARTKQVPHMMLMAGPHLNEKDFQQLLKALGEFGDQAQGKSFFRATGYEGLRPITDDDMRRLFHFIDRLKERLDF